MNSGRCSNKKCYCVRTAINQLIKQNSTITTTEAGVTTMKITKELFDALGGGAKLNGFEATVGADGKKYVSLTKQGDSFVNGNLSMNYNNKNEYQGMSINGAGSYKLGTGENIAGTINLTIDVYGRATGNITNVESGTILRGIDREGISAKGEAKGEGKTEGKEDKRLQQPQDT